MRLKVKVYISLYTYLVPDANCHDDIPDLDTSCSPKRLPEGVTHSLLQTIGTGTREHLVDSQDVVGVLTDSDVVAVLAACLRHVLVCADSSRLQRLKHV